MLTFKLEVRNPDLYIRNSFALTQSIPWTSKSQAKHRSYWMVSNYMNLDHTTSFSLPPHLDIEMVSISFTSKHPAERPKSTVQPVASAGTSPGHQNSSLRNFLDQRPTDELCKYSLTSSPHLALSNCTFEGGSWFYFENSLLLHPRSLLRVAIQNS